MKFGRFCSEESCGGIGSRRKIWGNPTAQKLRMVRGYILAILECQKTLLFFFHLRIFYKISLLPLFYYLLIVNPDGFRDNGFPGNGFLGNVRPALQGLPSTYRNLPIGAFNEPVMGPPRLFPDISKK